MQISFAAKDPARRVSSRASQGTGQGDDFQLSLPGPKRSPPLPSRPLLDSLQVSIQERFRAAQHWRPGGAEHRSQMTRLGGKEGQKFPPGRDLEPPPPTGPATAPSTGSGSGRGTAARTAQPATRCGAAADPVFAQLITPSTVRFAGLEPASASELFLNSSEESTSRTTIAGWMGSLGGSWLRPAAGESGTQLPAPVAHRSAKREEGARLETEERAGTCLAAGHTISVAFLVRFVSRRCFLESRRSYLFAPFPCHPLSSGSPETSAAAIMLLAARHGTVRMKNIQRYFGTNSVICSKKDEQSVRTDETSKETSESQDSAKENTKKDLLDIIKGMKVELSTVNVQTTKPPNRRPLKSLEVTLGRLQRATEYAPKKRLHLAWENYGYLMGIPYLGHKCSDSSYCMSFAGTLETAYGLVTRDTGSCGAVRQAACRSHVLTLR
ncbi:hypothetical protein H8959_013915 [Pygathrix nigripes]